MLLFEDENMGKLMIQRFLRFQEEIGDNLYDFLVQWFKLFPEYQTNQFFAFGESYAGKYIPTIATRSFLKILKNIINISMRGNWFFKDFSRKSHRGDSNKPGWTWHRRRDALTGRPVRLRGLSIRGGISIEIQNARFPLHKTLIF